MFFCIWVIQVEHASITGLHLGLRLYMFIFTGQVNHPRVTWDYLPRSWWRGGEKKKKKVYNFICSHVRPLSCLQCSARLSGCQFASKRLHSTCNELSLAEWKAIASHVNLKITPLLWWRASWFTTSAHSVIPVELFPAKTQSGVKRFDDSKHKSNTS